MISTVQQRRKRLPLSCERCRRLKRKCDRKLPCSECISTASKCSWHDGRSAHWDDKVEQPVTIKKSMNRKCSQDLRSDTPTFFASACLNERNNGSSQINPTASVPSSSSSISPFHNLPSTRSTGCLYTAESIKSTDTSDQYSPYAEDDPIHFLSNSYFLESVLSLWFRELDWMYDIVRGTPFERRWKNLGSSSFTGDEIVNSRYHPLVCAISALVFQLLPGDTFAMFFALGWNKKMDKTEALAIRLFEKAKSDVDFLHEQIPQTVNELQHSPSMSYVPLEAFQASLLLCAFVKNLGKPALYHERICRDIARLQHAGLHRYDTKFIDEDDRKLAHRLFWAYFTYDRLIIMLAPLPYTLTATHADMYLRDCFEEVYHVVDLCSEGRPSPFSSDKIARNRILQSSFSLAPFPAAMAQLASVAGRYTDQLSALRGQLTLNNDKGVTQQLEKMAAQADKELKDFDYRFRQKFIGHMTASSSPTSNHGFEVQYSVSERKTQELRPILLRSQWYVVLLTVRKLRRDIAIRLIQTFGNLTSFPSSLLRQRLDAARALLQCAFTLPSGGSLRGMGWSFFLFYISEPVFELLANTKETISNIQVHSQLDYIEEDLSYALEGRNLIVMIASQSGTSLAQSVANDVCASAQSTLSLTFDSEHELLRETLDLRLNVDAKMVAQSVITHIRRLMEGHATHSNFAESVGQLSLQIPSSHSTDLTGDLLDRNLITEDSSDFFASLEQLLSSMNSFDDVMSIMDAFKS